MKSTRQKKGSLKLPWHSTIILERLGAMLVASGPIFVVDIWSHSVSHEICELLKDSLIGFIWAPDSFCKTNSPPHPTSVHLTRNTISLKLTWNNSTQPHEQPDAYKMISNVCCTESWGPTLALNELKFFVTDWWIGESGLTELHFPAELPAIDVTVFSHTLGF